MNLSAPAAALRARAQGLERGVIAGALTLLLVGFVLALAASPVAAARLQLEGSFTLAWRHAVSAAAASAVLVGLSLLSERQVRRAAFGLGIVALVLLLAVFVFGPEINGARRWLSLFGVSLQPSELAKPAVIALSAWMLSEKLRTPGFPGYALALGLAAPFVALQVVQPDLGQTALLLATLAVMMFLAGAPLRFAPLGLGAAAVFLALAYVFVPYVRRRVTLFLDPERNPEQVERSLETIRAGGLIGVGPGEGDAKASLPDAHADFIYAVGAEEFGLLLSLGLPALYAWIAWRGLKAAAAAESGFARIAAGGLMTLFALQAAIHIAVNLNLAPTKGMTLPFVSFGGSAMLGSAVTIGMALALTRKAQPHG